MFDQTAKDNLIAYDNIQKIETDQKMIIISLLDYNYFKYYYKTIAVGLSKQQAQIEQIKFVKKLENNVTVFFVIEEAKETV